MDANTLLPLLTVSLSLLLIDFPHVENCISNVTNHKKPLETFIHSNIYDEIVDALNILKPVNKLCIFGPMFMR